MAARASTSLPIVVNGPGEHERRVPRCDAEAALFGPYTAATGWGRAWLACRTGPSPKYEFERAVRGDTSLRACFERLGVTWLDGSVLLSASGAVVRVTIDELEPAGLDVRPCLLRVARYRLVPAGCELESRLHFAQL